jgi:hypothetical protein
MARFQLTPAMSTSARLYRLLLVAYPARFRREYAEPMVQVFRDSVREAERQHGARGIAWLWLTTLGDLARTALVERVSEVIAMSRANWIRWGGLASMLLGAAWSLQWLLGGLNWQPGDVTKYSLSVTIPVLLLAALAGLAARAAGRWGWLGATGLAMCFLGPVLLLVGSVMLNRNDSSPWWELFVGGHLALFVGLLLAGGAVMRARALPHWNGLPLIMGLLGILSFFVVSALYGPWGDRNVLGFIPFSLTWVALGYALWSGTPEEAAPPPFAAV